MKKISIEVAAELMGKSSQFVRVGMQQGTIPIGAAVKNKGRYSYYISPGKLREFLGMDVHEFNTRVKELRWPQ